MLYIYVNQFVRFSILPYMCLPEGKFPIHGDGKCILGICLFFSMFEIGSHILK